MTTSPNFSFNGWSLWEFIKGRKKTAVTVVAGLLGYMISDSVTSAAVAGGFVEMVWALAEFYFKKVRV